jgi:sugar/nucleoside kinase (ribokinase family)
MPRDRQALFIGQTYIDVTFLTDCMLTGDEKYVASAYAVSFGGNAVTAAFCCAKLGHVPDVLTTVADDWLGRMFLDMAAKYGISIHVRKVHTSSLSFIMPNNGKRAIVRCRDDDYLHPFPTLHLNQTPRFITQLYAAKRGFSLPSTVGDYGRILTNSLN